MEEATQVIRDGYYVGGSFPESWSVMGYILGLLILFMVWMVYVFNQLSVRFAVKETACFYLVGNVCEARLTGIMIYHSPGYHLSKPSSRLHV